VIHSFQNKPSETNFWQQGDLDDLAAKEAYEALLTVSLLMPKSPIWNEFALKVQERALKYYGYVFPADEEVSHLISCPFSSTNLFKSYLQKPEGNNLHNLCLHCVERLMETFTCTPLLRSFYK